MSEDADDAVPEPRKNPYLVGHEAAAKEFISAFNSGRMAHAWLLSGPRGIGKATLAYRMARFILAQEAPSDSPGLFGAPPPMTSLEMSANHPVFRKAASGGHPDFRVLEREFTEKGDKRATVIKIKQVRDVLEFIYLTPAESAWRVVLVDGIDEMNEEAANAILKVLEEPPKRSILILVAHNADRLLPTIRSRCRRVELRPLLPTQVATLIGRYRLDLKTAEARALSVLGDGSVGRALEIADEGGMELFAELIALLGQAPSLPAVKLQALGDKTLRGDNFRTLAGLTTWWLARIAAQAARGDLDTADEIIPGEKAAARKLAHHPAALSEAWSEASYLAARTEAINIDKKRATMGLMLKVAELARRAAA